MKTSKSGKGNAVFAVSLLVTLLTAAWAICGSSSFMNFASALYGFLSKDMGWLYLLLIGGFVLFCLFLAFSRYGNIKLGADDEEPEYGAVSWFAMLFCAGMGVGLVFWSVSEPLAHFLSPDGIEGGTGEAADFAMQATFMHWGIHPWTIYAICGLAIAYFSYRKGEKNLLSCSFIPIIGRERVRGWMGKTIDIYVVFLTVMGVSSSLGLGALQINGGLSYLSDVEYSLRVQIVIIVAVTIAFTISSVSGVDKGIKMLSNGNLLLAVFLAAAAFLIGPRVEIVNSFVSGVGSYLSGILEESFKFHLYGDNSWIINWRVFYWAWWISWGPFTGSFIARISRGRTIRQFMIGVLLVPTVFSCIWFAIFGNLGISLAIKRVFSLDALSEMVATPETALFTILNEYPVGAVLSVIAVVLLFTFLITSADSGSFVLGMFTSDGDENPSTKRKVTWCVVISLLAVGFLVTGGLSSVQTISLGIAFPFLFIMLVCCWSLLKCLRKERKTYRNRVERKL